MTLFLEAADDAAAELVCDEVAELCDRLLGRPSSEESRLLYILIWEGEEGEDNTAWLEEILARPGARGLILPTPVGELN